MVKSDVGGGDWSIVGYFVASHCESHSVGFFLLGSDVAYYAAIGDIAVLGNLMPVDKETCVCFLDVSDSLE